MNNKVSCSWSLFKKYLIIQRSGIYNMATDWVKIISILNCSKEQYFDILKNYKIYKDKYKDKKISDMDIEEIKSKIVF